MNPMKIAIAVLLAAAVPAQAFATDREAGESGSAELVRRIDASLRSAAEFLCSAQSKDGSWRGESYGCFRDGHALTPYVMSSLFFMPQGGEAAKRAFMKGVDFLMSFVDRQGRLVEPARGFEFPVYTSAMAGRVVVLANRDKDHLAGQKAWLGFLLDRRLGSALGWDRSDTDFGGFGFSVLKPRKPRPGEPPENFFESNLSATVFGIAALRSAKTPQDDSVYAEILEFVYRCQNYQDDPDKLDPKFDDGGFFFRPGDPLQNKAGVAGTDRSGRQRFVSYGTMTADGLRALVRCGLPLNHPRVAAARAWLERNWSASTHPGAFPGDREVLRESTYYYWCWAAAHAFQAVNARLIDSSSGRVDWATDMAKELLRRQAKDGTWRNSYTDAKEDDPLVAVPWAAAALAICRSVLTGEAPTLFPRPAAPHAQSSGR